MLAFQALGIASFPVIAQDVNKAPGQTSTTKRISELTEEAIILVKKDSWTEKAKNFADKVNKSVRLDVREGFPPLVSVYNSSGNEKFDEEAKASLQAVLKANKSLEKMPSSYFLFSPDGSVQHEDLKEVDYGTYMRDVQKAIKEHWFPPKQVQPLRTVLFFYIQSDGSIKDLQVKRSSGLEACDLAALQAVERCASFPPLPQNAPDQIQIEFSLDYNMLSSRKETLTPAEQIDNLWKGAIQVEIAKLKQELK